MTGQPTLTPRAEIEARIHGLQAAMQKEGIDATLILQNSDLYYFAGTIQQAHLYIPCEGQPLLLVRKSLARAREESPLPTILSLASPKQLPAIIAEHGLKAPRRLGMELDVVPANNYFAYARIFADAEIKDISLSIRMQRAVKSDHELELIRQAAQRSDEIAGLMPKLIKKGMTEIELAGKVEAHMRRLGHQGVVRMRLWGAELFYGHLMSGPSAAVPSYLASPTGGPSVSAAVAQGAGFRQIGPNEPILLDYVFAWQGYISDHTRIFCLGAPPAKLLEGHDQMLALQEEIKRMATPGTPAGALYDAAMAIAADKGLEENFMGVGKERIRFIGHGVGLELDEFPFLAKGQTTVLQENMVIALEPKLIFPGLGVVGIENTHRVTANGLEQLTVAPEKITVL